MKKITLLLLIMTLCLTVCLTACSDGPSYEVKTSSDGVWSYHLNDDGTITLDSINSLSENMTVPATVDGLTVSAFGEKLFVIIDDGSNKKSDKGVYRENLVLKTVDIQAQIKELPPMTFYYCSKLENVTLPTSLESIGAFSFFNCVSLKSIVIPSKTNNIGEYAFRQCTSLSTVVIDGEREEVPTIGDKAFYNLDENVPKDQQYYISDALNIFVTDISLYDATRLNEKRIATKEKTYKYWGEYVAKGSVKESK